MLRTPVRTFQPKNPPKKRTSRLGKKKGVLIKKKLYPRSQKNALLGTERVMDGPTDGQTLM